MLPPLLRKFPMSSSLARGSLFFLRSPCSFRKLSAPTGSDSSSPPSSIQLSKLISQYATNLAISRNAAETLIKQGDVTFAGKVVRSPHMLVDIKDIARSGSVVIKVNGKGVQLNITSETNVDVEDSKMPIVYAVHKLKGEVVTENDPQNRPSMIRRLVQGGVGLQKVGKIIQKMHLKPIGRLDIPTEGLCLVTNDGVFAREMELPKNQVQRVYRARVHGPLTSAKLNRIRTGGVRFKEIRYGPMKVSVEKSHGTQRRNSPHATATNTWVQITSIEGKNRQIRNVFEALGITRLIRISYGDYTLHSIPPGMAIQVPYKPVKNQKAKGPLVPKMRAKSPSETGASDVKWVRSAQ